MSARGGQGDAKSLTEAREHFKAAETTYRDIGDNVRPHPAVDCVCHTRPHSVVD